MPTFSASKAHLRFPRSPVRRLNPFGGQRRFAAFAHPARLRLAPSISLL